MIQHPTLAAALADQRRPPPSGRGRDRRLAREARTAATTAAPAHPWPARWLAARRHPPPPRGRPQGPGLPCVPARAPLRAGRSHDAASHSHYQVK